MLKKSQKPLLETFKKSTSDGVDLKNLSSLDCSKSVSSSDSKSSGLLLKQGL